MNIKYKGTKLKDSQSKKAKVLNLIKREYGSLGLFLKDLELEVKLQ